MSLVQFDELYEICCEMADIPNETKPVIVINDDDYWWEKVAQEVLHEEVEPKKKVEPRKKVEPKEKKEILTV